ncbi:GNAT family N-acetyltransferase [Alteromonas sp. ASW11-130]|uniref:GNAT family N-acetyltransferase n=1 Tax=Alteromonas sp. ASW11-130 TaxID=3015775 RepID=UPI002241DDCA|nr:GNAT family N-acetyltransferase [Alteromonas sp. ASW11-130]MCW8090915.1 GNAT family N-acetyltransferase [Alteromonas sp. ASW11-130]
MISYQRCDDLAKSAEMTLRNMRFYYEQFAVDWDHNKILQQITELENWDILYQGKVIGAIRLAFDEDGCYLRDLQVDEAFQNKGIGAQSLTETKRIALQSGADKLRLRVMKISPAINLYKRDGFNISQEDDRFYYMEQSLA